MLRISTLLIGLGIGLGSGAVAWDVAAQVYQWRDAAGRTHYSDQAPPGEDSTTIEPHLPPQGVRLVPAEQSDAWSEQVLTAPPQTEPSSTEPNKIRRRPGGNGSDASEEDLCAGVVGDCFSDAQDYVCKLRFGYDCKAIYHWKVCLHQDCEDKKVADKCQSPWHLLDRRPPVMTQMQMGRNLPLRELVSERDWECLSKSGFFCDELAVERVCQQRYERSCEELRSWPLQAQARCRQQRGADCDQIDGWLSERPLSWEERKKIGNRLPTGGYQNQDLLLQSLGDNAADADLWPVLEALPGLNIRARRHTFDCHGEWREYRPW